MTVYRVKGVAVNKPTEDYRPPLQLPFLAHCFGFTTHNVIVLVQSHSHQPHVARNMSPNECYLCSVSAGCVTVTVSVC